LVNEADGIAPGVEGDGAVGYGAGADLDEHGRGGGEWE
jgi:hypothetical protein